MWMRTPTLSAITPIHGCFGIVASYNALSTTIGKRLFMVVPSIAHDGKGNDSSIWRYPVTTLIFVKQSPTCRRHQPMRRRGRHC
ncbi:hypothetical protein EMIT0P260_150098 [Pseudomonas sp. IT-P260]